MKTFQTALALIFVTICLVQASYASDFEGTVTGESEPSGMGTVDRLDFETGEIVIDDVLFFIGPGTKFFSQEGVPESKDRFTEGMTSHYLVDNNDNLLAIWKVDEEGRIERFDTQTGQEPDEPDQDISPASIQSDEDTDAPYTLKDGVWTN